MVAFPSAGKRELGYDKSQVDAFIQRARDQYSRPDSKVIDWRSLNAERFDLVKAGYDIAAVDSAIDKLEDTFAERDIKSPVFQFPVVTNQEKLTDIRNLLLNRMSWPRGKKFERSRGLEVGYSRKSVDRFLELVEEFLEDGNSIDLAELRELTFKIQRGGYIESQVDQYIDRLQEFIQTQRFTS